MTICIYHNNCADGFGAAWVVKQALQKIEGDSLVFYPAKYQEPPPDVTNENVVIVDFSYKRPVLLEMAQKASSILILDHHITAMADLHDLPENVTATFDMNHSGTMLAWKHFFPHDAPPPLLLHIEDRDLWRFKLRNTRQIQAALFSYPYEFDKWDLLMSTDPKILAMEGESIERKHLKDIRESLAVTTRQMVIGGYYIPVANLPPTMSSDAGHELAKGQPFAACWWMNQEDVVFSLRSSEDGLDVSEVAKNYGGGGHRNASGFKVSIERFTKEFLCVNRPTWTPHALPGW